MAFLAANQNADGIYKHTDTSAIYASGAFLNAFLLATGGDAIKEKHYAAVEQAFDNCADNKGLVLISVLKPGM